MYDKYIMPNPYLRTQILIPADLREKIDKHRMQKNESLSEYLRRAAKLRLQKTRDRNTDLETISNKVIGKLDLKKYPQWRDYNKIIIWQKSLRKDRKT